jgi:hypothetical protein
VVTDYKGDQEQAVLDFQILLSEAIRAAAYVLRPGEKICYTYMKLEGNGANIDKFLNDLQFVTATPDDSVEYHPDAINPNGAEVGVSPLLKDDGTVDSLYHAPTAAELLKEAKEELEMEANKKKAPVKRAISWLYILIAVLAVVVLALGVVIVKMM